VLLISGHTTTAQGPPTAPPNVVGLQRGRPFVDDVRRLPSNLPNQREHRPDRGIEREEPPLPSAIGSADRSAQITLPALAAPAPPPGSGSGAGSFAGLDFQHWGDGWPPDTNGDVGPTHYIQTVNTSIGIFRKSDGAMVAAFSFDTLMGQGQFGNACDNQNFGDPVVVWDSAADRWIISDFAFVLNAGNPVAPYFQCFAVSRSSDPVSGGWNFYSLQTNDLFPDYPKLGVWPDGLYLTANMFTGNTFKNVRVWALDKSQMYAGNPVSAVAFDLPGKVQGVSVFTGIPSTYHTVTGTPPAGRPNFISVIWSAKLARVWKFHVDWNNTANSSLTGPSNVTLASWGVANTTVPVKNGNALDSLRERLMVQSQYTNRAGAESLWLTHSVANPGNSAVTSPRWYQINVTGGTVLTSAPVQQSTWAPDSTIARWMPSLAVDKDGNMAIGYSASSSTLFPAIRYAGRLTSDPANTLGQTETSLIEGTASQCCTFSDGSINNRWGDYSGMSIDPDGCTFWYTTEYYQSPQPSSLALDNWQTRIGSFKFASCTPGSIAATSLAAASATGTYGGTSTLSATLTAGAVGVSGKTINFTVNGNAAGSASTNASGVATVSNVSLSGINAGTYASGVGASFAGDSSYASSSGVNSLTIGKANQTITFGAIADKTTSDPPFTVTATASSTLTVAFSASGNCTVSGSTVTITGAGSCAITASQSGNINYNPAPDVIRSFNITAGTSTAVNVALAANGGVASASSIFSGGYSAAGAINGDRKGLNWGADGYWNDGTGGSFPDWLEVDFNGSKTIGEIDVFSVQDNWQAPSEPTSAMTFSLYGLTDFQAQYWTGTQWATVPNGVVSGNNLVWRKITFGALTTAKIRVWITGAQDPWSRLAEVEAWTAASNDISVALSSPANGATFTAPATIALAATAGSGTGVTKVDFFANGNLVGTDTTNPYGFSWQNVSAGSYTLTAVATNTVGAATSSAPVAITVNGSVSNVNVALASNGAVATASSMYSSVYPPSGAINGDREGLDWGAGGYWNDATGGAFPDWLEVDFNGAKTIGEIDVFSVQDNWQSPSEPTATMTFGLYGLTDFEVQYWNGTQWVAVPGGSITGNNLVWRKLTFAALTTTKIRVWITAAQDPWSRIAEVEAWGQ